MVCPSKTFKVDKFVITRYYNNNKDVFGGKDYVDVIEEPFYMTDLDGLDKKDRKVVEDFMEKQPKKKRRVLKKFAQKFITNSKEVNYLKVWK